MRKEADDSMLGLYWGGVDSPTFLPIRPQVVCRYHLAANADFSSLSIVFIPCSGDLIMSTQVIVDPDMVCRARFVADS